jgi:multidrug efflux system membrane fusion protein
MRDRSDKNFVSSAVYRCSLLPSLAPKLKFRLNWLQHRRRMPHGGETEHWAAPLTKRNLLSSLHLTWCVLASSLIVAATFTAACSGGGASPKQEQGGGQPSAVPVKVAPVVQKAMPLEIRVIGAAVTATVAVHAQITGELTSVNFNEGDDVEAGQVLFTLDRRPLEAALQQEQANLERDLAQATNVKAQATRYRDLAERGIATREQVDQITANAAALDATVGADRAVVENAKLQLEYATIAATMSGRTGALMVHAGNLVRADDTTPLVVIKRLAPIHVSFGIPEAQLPDFKRYLAQKSLHVEARPPNETGPASNGRISFVDNAVDQTTGTIKIKGMFPNDDRRLWPGQFVNIVVTLTTDPAAIVVPTIAVQAGPQGQYVFVVKPDQTAELRTVTLARTSGTEAIIKDGLKAGETVITDGQLRLVSGTRITVKTETSQEAAP